MVTRVCEYIKTMRLTQTRKTVDQQKSFQRIKQSKMHHHVCLYMVFFIVENPKPGLGSKTRLSRFPASSSADFMQMYLLNFPVIHRHTFSLTLLLNLYIETCIWYKFLFYLSSKTRLDIINQNICSYVLKK